MRPTTGFKAAMTLASLEFFTLNATERAVVKTYETLSPPLSVPLKVKAVVVAPAGVANIASCAAKSLFSSVSAAIWPWS